MDVTADSFEYILTTYDQRIELANRQFLAKRNPFNSYCLLVDCEFLEVVDLRNGQVLQGSHQRQLQQKLADNGERPGIPPNVTSYTPQRAAWMTPGGKSGCLADSLFVEHDIQGTRLLLYELTQSDDSRKLASVTITSQCLLADLKTQLASLNYCCETNSLYLLGYHDYICTCLLGNLFVRFMFPSEGNELHVKVVKCFNLHLGIDSQCFKGASYICGHLALLTQEQLSLYNSEGIKTLQIPLAGIIPYSAEEKRLKVTHFKILSNLQTVIFFTQLNLTVIDLDSFIHHHPQFCLFRQQMPNAVSDSESSKSVSSKHSSRWSEKIDSLQQTVSRRDGQSKKYSTINSSKTSQWSNNRVCGFKVKQLQSPGEVSSLPGSVQETKMEAEYLRRYNLPDIDLKVEDICTSGFSLYLMGSDINYEPQGFVIIHMDLTDGTLTVHRTGKTVTILLSESAMVPVQLLTAEGLHGVVFRHLQETLVNKLMLYENAAVADTLCSINAWDRCSLPMHALEVGLHHRQLDTVAFFLKNKENLFSLPKTTINEINDPSNLDPVSIAPGDLHYDDLELQQLDDSMTLLIKTIAVNNSDNQSKPFAEQLISITFNYLHKVIRAVIIKQDNVLNAGMSTSDFETSTQGILNMLTDYIVQLRNFMYDMPQAKLHYFKDQLDVQSEGQLKGHGDMHSEGHHLGQVESGENDLGLLLGTVLTEQQKTTINIWDTLDEKAVIVEGLLSGNVPLLQVYLRDRYTCQSAHLSYLVQVGFNEVLVLLHDRDMTGSTCLIANMGYDVATKLRQICLNTPDRSLRSYLSNELLNKGLMTDHETQMLHFIHQVETLYSCPSFEMAKVLKNEFPSNFAGALDLSSFMPATSTSVIPKQCGEISNADVGNYEMSHYSNLLLEWTRNWNKESWARIILEQALQRKDQLFIQDIEPKVVWEYLCDHLDVKRIEYWISKQYPDPNHKAGPVVHAPPTWPFNQPITGAMMEKLHSSPCHIRDAVLNQFARRGLFSPSEQRDLSRLVTHLSRLGSTIQKPHLLTRRPDSHSVKLQQLHRHIIQYAMQNNQPELLYFYLDFWGVYLDGSWDDEFGLTDVEVPAWVDMLLHFRLAARSLTDPECVFKASLAASRVTQGLQQGSVAAMLEDGLTGRVLASLMFSLDQLQQFMEQPTAKAKSALLALPRIHRVLFPVATDHYKQPLQQDITVYQLLSGNAAFDPSTLFGWHATNTLATEGAPKELPHFSQEDLVRKYAHKENLDFVYYLKQGRPSFAFSAFIIGQIEKGYKRIAFKSAHKACLHAEWLSLKYHHITHISAACIAFIEMLGVDTFLPRLRIQVAHSILQYQMSLVTGSLEQQKQEKVSVEKELCRLMLGSMHQSHSALRQVAGHLQNAIQWSINKSSFKRCSLEAGQIWLLSILFTRCHHLPVCHSFLQDCASEDDWLMFLTYAQLNQYTTAQLKELIPLFPSHQLQDHLGLLLDNLQPSDVRSPSLSPPGTNPPSSTTRDFRAQLYAKIGLPQVEPDQDSSSSNDFTDTDTVDDVTLAQCDVDLLLPADFDASSHDLMDILFICEREALPWRSLCAACLRTNNPSLAVLAACYQDHDVITCLTCWIMASLPESLANEFSSHFPHMESRDLTKEDLSRVVMVMIDGDAVKLLLTALQIFQPSCCLVPFLSFCHGAKIGECSNTLEGYLENFKSAFVQLKASDDLTLFPLTWVESVIMRLLDHCLGLLSHHGVMAGFLPSLDQTNTSRLLSCKAVPNMANLHQIHYIISGSKVKLDYRALGRPQTNAVFKQEAQRVLGVLVGEHSFSEARLFAQVAAISHGSITLNQLDHELAMLKSSRAWNEECSRLSFWQHCHDTLQKYGVSPETAACYFQDKVGECNGMEESGRLLQFAYDWLNQSETANNSDEKKTVFVALWLNKIQQAIGKEKEVKTSGKSKNINIMCKEQLLDPRCTSSQPQVTLSDNITLTQAQYAALDGLLGDLLDCGRVLDALEVAETFHHHSQDLSIILTCLRLAFGVIEAKDLDLATRQLLAGPMLSPRSRRSSTTLLALPRMGSVVSLVSQMSVGGDLCEWEEAGMAGESTAATISTLIQYCLQGQRSANFISTIYSIAQVMNWSLQVLKQSFSVVLQQDNIAVLHALLSCDATSRVVLAKAFITGLGLTDTEVAGFLCDGILQALQIQAGISEGTFDHKSQSFILGSAFDASKTFAVSRSRSGIIELIQLCEDPSVLGQRLLDAVICLHSSTVELSNKMLSVEVELLICAHDCFTLACHMDGISSLLRSARQVTALLAEAKEYNLMVHLLTGVARFNEMAYIFDILMEKHQFELLFRKGIEKEAKLRVAILDYLQRHHPEDTDTHMMAALHFSMYRAIAQTLLHNAHKLIEKLTAIDNCNTTQKTLSTALNYFSDAAESFCKENCLRQAEKCVQQARLVALQLHLLSSRVKVVNLSRAGVEELVVTHPKFYEAFIVCEAYGLHGYWAKSIYNHVVKAGNIKYLHDYKVHRRCTSSLISEVAQKYESEGKPSKQITANMQNLLLTSSLDVVTRYNFAKKLGFSDIVTELSQGEATAYLKDVKAIKD